MPEGEDFYTSAQIGWLVAPGKKLINENVYGLRATRTDYGFSRKAILPAVAVGHPPGCSHIRHQGRARFYLPISLGLQQQANPAQSTRDHQLFYPTPYLDMTTLPEPDFDDTRLAPTLRWLLRELLRDLRALLLDI